MNLHDDYELTQDVIAALTAAGLTVGEGEAPAAVPAGSGYVVVYPLTGGLVDGPLGNPSDDAEVPYQVTALGTSVRQAQVCQRRARQALLTATWTLPGRTVAQVRVEALGGILRDDSTAAPARFVAREQYTIVTTPT